LLRILLLFVTCCYAITCFGQKSHVLNDSSSVEISSYSVLPDRGYTIDRIATDTSLNFEENGLLNPQIESVYWIRIKIRNPFYYAEKYNIWLFPYLNNTLYYFDGNLQKWEGHKAGINAGLLNRNQRTISRMSFMMRGNAVNTLFIRAEVGPLWQFGQIFKPEIQLRKQAFSDEREQVFQLGWVAAISVLLLFFMNNLLVYFNFRDKAILYLLLAQLGGMIYITSYRFFFANFIPIPIYSFWMSANGNFEYYDLNSLLQHIGILLVMYGCIQFTRTHLNTTKTLPLIDGMLRYGLAGYASITVLIILFNLTFYCTTEGTILYENILALLLTACILLACVMGYIRKVHGATSFLLANAAPLVFIIGLAAFHVFVSVHTKDTFMPELSVVAQAFGFSIALVARTKMLQNDLRAEEIRSQKLEFDLDALEMRKRLVELEVSKVNAEMSEERIRNELLNRNLEAHQRELASTTLYIVQKNEMLVQLKKQIENNNQRYPENKYQVVNEIKSILNSNLHLDHDWSRFKLHFEQVHPDFFGELLARHPSLTKNEVRLYAYFHINLSTKEIAALLNVDPGSVRRAKSRLYKKMALPERDQDSRE